MAICGGKKAALDCLVRHGASLEATTGDESTLTPLQCAIMSDNLSMVKCLVEHAASVNDKDNLVIIKE